MSRIAASLAFEISAHGPPDAARDRADEAGRLNVKTTAAVKALADVVLGSWRIADRLRMGSFQVIGTRARSRERMRLTGTHPAEGRRSLQGDKEAKKSSIASTGPIRTRLAPQRSARQ
jgi:hypothetical protein